jgi:transcription antitermination factor NusG
MLVNESTPWLVMYTRFKYERKVLTEIQALTDVEGYLPFRVVERQKAQSIQFKKEPLFPNYLFVRNKIKDRNRLFKIDGVVKFVCFEGRPALVPDAEIAKIRLMESHGTEVQLERYGFPEGSRVKVVRGVFCGLEGRMVRRIRNTRLIVSIPALKQATSVEISEMDVVAMDCAAQPSSLC